MYVWTIIDMYTNKKNNHVFFLKFIEKIFLKTMVPESKILL